MVATAGNSMARKLWEPRDPSKTNMSQFRKWVNTTRGLNLQTYRDLHSWSTARETADEFWVALFQYLRLKPSITPTRAVEKAHGGLLFPPPRWFPQVRMNFAEHLLFGTTRSPEQIVFHACSEGGTNLRHVTCAELWASVEKMADAMISAGIRTGDRVAAIISNRPETITCCLAALSIGAIWSTSSPDMGTKGILDRMMQIRPKIVFAESSVVYNGKRRDLMAKHREWTRQMASTPDFLRTVLIVESADVQTDLGNDFVTWDAFLKKGVTGRKLEFQQLPFHHPGFIVFSSGTTGPPKCIVHSAGGLLLQVKKDYVLSIDVRPEDTVFQYTTTGWIMWALALCGLSYGAKMLVYDGSPFKPDPTVLLRLASQLKVSVFGTSARYLTDLMTLGVKPRDLFDLSSLRVVTSTGSVLTAEVAEWFYDVGFPPDVHLVSCSGGTDLACSLVIGDPTNPFYAGEIQTEALGMAIDILDTGEEQPVSIKQSGQPGELVCRAPFPSQPVGFWGDADMVKYGSTYYERFGPRVWYQGDFVSVVPSTGGYIMLGRSDGVLNPSGVRFGSAEIYNVLNSSRFPDFADTVCVGQRRPQDIDETVVLFVKMLPGKTLTPAITSQIRDAISKALSPRHVPKYVFQVDDVPYTTNGKKVEFAVKQIVSGRKVKSTGALANPECLVGFEKFFHVERLAKL